RAPDAVPAELANDGAALALGELLDRRADVAEARAVLHLKDPHVAAAARDVDHVERLGGGLADHEGRRRVAVKTAELGRDVDVHDVALPEDLVLLRDAVAHDLVPARAHRRRKYLVPQLARLPPAAARVLAHPRVDLSRGDALLDLRADEGERLCGHAA